ncbi:MAG: DUF4886 domain-containing protein, partial [Clostridia bacterium]|nr:DUF4886 domain-containing protein [Clostridia bacterium]
MNILFIGNSFSRDTVQHMGMIAGDAGMEPFRLANLYIGGCSIQRHFNNAVNDLSEYRYSETADGTWEGEEYCSVSDALKKGVWDIVSIQHGTGDKSRYTATESYEKLPALIEYVRKTYGKPVKIAFNMTWIGEPESPKSPELRDIYGNDQLAMYEAVAKLTRDTVLPLVDVFSPTGTTIQNLRTCLDKPLTRDTYHLSYDLGRYAAGLTYLKAVCDLPVDLVRWAPDGVSERERDLAKRAAELAVQNPFSV